MLTGNLYFVQQIIYLIKGDVEPRECDCELKQVTTLRQRERERERERGVMNNAETFTF